MAKKLFPVRLLQLDATDAESTKKDGRGRPATHAIEQLDGDRYLFPTQPDAERFLHQHGLQAIGDLEFISLKKAMAAKA